MSVNLLASVLLLALVALSFSFFLSPTFYLFDPAANRIFLGIVFLWSVELFVLKHN